MNELRETHNHNGNKTTLSDVKVPPPETHGAGDRRCGRVSRGGGAVVSWYEEMRLIVAVGKERRALDNYTEWVSYL